MDRAPALRSRLGVLGLIIGAAACGERADSRSDTTTLPPPLPSASARGLSDTIPAQPYTWTLGAMDSLMRRRYPDATRRSPVPETAAPRLNEAPSAEYALPGVRVDAYLLGDQVTARTAMAEARARAVSPARSFLSNNLLVIVQPPNARIAEPLEQLLTSHDARSARARQPSLDPKQ